MNIVVKIVIQKTHVWELHRKPLDWKLRQNYRNRGYQATIDHQTEKFQDEQSNSSRTFNP